MSRRNTRRSFDFLIPGGVEAEESQAGPVPVAEPFGDDEWLGDLIDNGATAFHVPKSCGYNGASYEPDDWFAERMSGRGAGWRNNWTLNFDDD